MSEFYYHFDLIFSPRIANSDSCALTHGYWGVLVKVLIR